MLFAIGKVRQRSRFRAIPSSGIFAASPASFPTNSRDPLYKQYRYVIILVVLRARPAECPSLMFTRQLFGGPCRPALLLTPTHADPYPTLLYFQSDGHLLSFQQRKPFFLENRGWHYRRSEVFPAPVYPEPRAVACHSPLSPLESALTDELRVLAEIGRSCFSLTPLESAVTDTPFHNHLYSQHIQKKRGGGGALC